MYRTKIQKKSSRLFSGSPSGDLEFLPIFCPSGEGWSALLSWVLWAREWLVFSWRRCVVMTRLKAPCFTPWLGVRLRTKATTGILSDRRRGLRPIAEREIQILRYSLVNAPQKRLANPLGIPYIKLSAILESIIERTSVKSSGVIVIECGE